MLQRIFNKIVRRLLINSTLLIISLLIITGQLSEQRIAVVVSIVILVWYGVIGVLTATFYEDIKDIGGGTKKIV